jgi:hypothetical protein
MGYNQWIGWMVKVLERTQLENWWHECWERSIYT